MSPHRRQFSTLVLSFGCALLITTGCLGNDFADLPLGANEWDHGWTLAIEPEEHFEVDLQGNAAYPDAPWRIAEFDTTVLAIEHQQHEVPRPARGNPEAMEPGEYDPGSLKSNSRFSFVGISTGETRLRFEILGDGVPVDVAEYTIVVTDDACSANTAAVANRCGTGFSYHPQEGLTEWDQGRTVPMEPGDELVVTLAANALYPEAPWQLADLDKEIATVEGPDPIAATRNPGDFSETDPDVSHSFLQLWRLIVRGIALGESPLALEMVADGHRVDLFEITLAVVEDVGEFPEQ